MATREQFEMAYRLLEDVTPLPFDCGKLCGKICCTPWEKDVGIYLLPGEEVMFTGEEDWLVWESHSTEEYEFCPSWSGAFYFVRCTRFCPREKRPFQCRSFPLVPHLKADGTLELRFNEFGLYMCPIVKAQDMSILRSDFIRNVRLAWEILMKDPLIRDDVKWQSQIREEGEGQPWMKLIGQS